MNAENWVAAASCAIAVLVWLRVALVLVARRHPRAAGMVTYPFRRCWWMVTRWRKREHQGPRIERAELDQHDWLRFRMLTRSYHQRGEWVPEPDRTRGQA